MITYIFEFTVFLSLFWVIYELFLKKETFFGYNRLYLLFTPILAGILPFLEISFFRESIGGANLFQQLPAVFLGEQTTETTNEISTGMVNSSGNFDWVLFFEAVYIIGMVSMLVLALLKVYRLHRLKKSAVKMVDNNMSVWEVSNSKIACTFLNQIFLGGNLSEDEKEQILLHEKVHLEQKHTYDLVFFELLKIIFWFNPFIYRYQSLLRSVHEYIADSEAIIKTSKTTYYERLLNVAFDTQKIAFINQFFNQSLIKKRILMLQQARSNRTAKLKYLFLIPLILGMMLYVSCSQDETSTDSSIENQMYKTDADIQDMNVENKSLSVQDINNLSEEVNDQTKQILLKALKNGKPIKTLTKDEMNKLGIMINYPFTEVPNPPAPPAAPDKSLISEVPFTAIDEAPVYPGCEASGSKEELKKCMSEHITEFVNKNFDTDGITGDLKNGVNKVYVRFTINSNGKVVDIDARAANQALVAEGKRVIKSLPNFKPGLQDGKPVDVLYSLPIIFQVKE